MTKNRRWTTAVLVAAAFLMTLQGGEMNAGEAAGGTAAAAKKSNAAVRYMEIVSDDMDALCATYESVHGVSFGEVVPELGQARVANLPDGSLLSIRKPMAEHETPIIRTYVAVADIEKAVEAAKKAGAELAYMAPHGEWGTFAIYIHGGVQHGLWQR